MKRSLDAFIIEDDEADAFFARRTLDRSGLLGRVTIFQYARKALEALNHNSVPAPDLIMVDLNMPGMNGTEFARRLAEDMPEIRANLQIWMLTSSIDPRDIAQALNDCGVDRVVPKNTPEQTIISYLKSFPGL
ncbi:MAG: response regulator [Mangrovicoccus sp.]